MRLAALTTVVLLLGSGCKKEHPRYAVGPVSIGVPPGFLDDVERAGKLGERAISFKNESRVWKNNADKMQLALSVAKLPHQPEWDKVSNTVLLTEMVRQELEAGEKAGLTTVDSSRTWEGAVLHYAVEGDMKGQLATSSHTAVWVDGAGDCWHASAVCTAKPVDRPKCVELMKSVKFDIPPLTADAGT